LNNQNFSFQQSAIPDALLSTKEVIVLKDNSTYTFDYNLNVSPAEFSFGSCDTTYPFVYDLAELWFEFTGKPFVFAAWVANRELSAEFIVEFNEALSFGLHNIDAALDVYADESQKEELKNYLTNYISYDLDQDKKEGMELFLKYMKAL
jgi:predicted solute-binding protein